MVKVTKRALKAVIKEITFTDDALYTIMTELKSTVNSRPLINISDNIDDYEALTLNYFFWDDDPITLHLLTTKKLM